LPSAQGSVVKNLNCGAQKACGVNSSFLIKSFVSEIARLQPKPYMTSASLFRREALLFKKTQEDRRRDHDGREQTDEFMLYEFECVKR